MAYKKVVTGMTPPQARHLRSLYWPEVFIHCHVSRPPGFELENLGSQSETVQLSHEFR